MVEDGKKENTLVIYNKGGAEKVRVVDETNRGEVTDSWLQAWGRQA